MSVAELIDELNFPFPRHRRLPSVTYSNLSISNEAIGYGDGEETSFNSTLTWIPVAPGTVTVTDGSGDRIAFDNSSGAFFGDGSGTIDYRTGKVSIVFAQPVGAMSTVEANYVCSVDTLNIETIKVGDGTTNT